VSTVGADLDALVRSARVMEGAAGELRRVRTDLEGTLTALVGAGPWSAPAGWVQSVRRTVQWCEEQAADQLRRAAVLDELDRPVPAGADPGAELARRLDVDIERLACPWPRSEAALAAAAAGGGVDLARARDALAALPASATGAFAERFPALASRADAPLGAQVAANRRRIAASVDDLRRRARVAGRHGDLTAAAELTGQADRAAALLDRQVLRFDPVTGQTVVALGDVSRYDVATVFVPDVFRPDMSRDDWLRVAEDVHGATAAMGSAPLTILVIGFDGPGGVRSRWSGRSAAAGGRELAQLLTALPLRPDARRTVVGYGHGAVVVGEAAALGARADALVAVGAPGMAVDHAGQLEAASGAEVYVLRAPEDWWTMVNRNPAPLLGPVAAALAPPAFADTVDMVLHVEKAPGLGEDPSEPEFGATRLDTGDIRGHGDYFDVGTVALAQVAAVAAGRDDRLRDVTADSELEQFRADLIDSVDTIQALGALPHDSVDRVVDAVQTVLPGFTALPIDTAQWIFGIPHAAEHEMIDLAQEGADELLARSGDGADLAADGIVWTAGTVADRFADVGAAGLDAGGDLAESAGAAFHPRRWNTPW
jgi:hypothetical protein